MSSSWPAAPSAIGSSAISSNRWPKFVMACARKRHAGVSWSGRELMTTDRRALCRSARGGPRASGRWRRRPRVGPRSATTTGDWCARRSVQSQNAERVPAARSSASPSRRRSRWSGSGWTERRWPMYMSALSASPSYSAGRRARSRVRTTISRSVWSIPSHARIISTNGWYRPTAPYERQSPSSQVTFGPRFSRSSPRRRDLPIPASPIRSSDWPRPARRSSAARRRCAASASLPTRGDWVWSRPVVLRRSTRQADTGAARPLSASSPIGSSTKRGMSRCAVVSPVTIVPGSGRRPGAARPRSSYRRAPPPGAWPPRPRRQPRGRR